VRLAPGAPLGDLTSDREALARIVGPRLEPWLREGATALQKLSVEDRRLLEPGFLYVCYHRCVPQLDALIERQGTGRCSSRGAVRRRRDRGPGAQRLSGGARSAFFRVVFSSCGARSISSSARYASWCSIAPVRRTSRCERSSRALESHEDFSTTAPRRTGTKALRGRDPGARSSFRTPEQRRFRRPTSLRAFIRSTLS